MSNPRRYYAMYLGLFATMLVFYLLFWLGHDLNLPRVVLTFFVLASLAVGAITLVISIVLLAFALNRSSND